MVIVTAVTAIFPQPHSGVINPFSELAWPLLKEGYGVRNLGMLLLGLEKSNMYPLAVLICGASAWMILVWHDETDYVSIDDSCVDVGDDGVALWQDCPEWSCL